MFAVHSDYIHRGVDMSVSHILMLAIFPMFLFQPFISASWPVTCHRDRNSYSWLCHSSFPSFLHSNLCWSLWWLLLFCYMSGPSSLRLCTRVFVSRHLLPCPGYCPLLVMVVIMILLSSHQLYWFSGRGGCFCFLRQGLTTQCRLALNSLMHPRLVLNSQHPPTSTLKCWNYRSVSLHPASHQLLMTLHTAYLIFLYY